MRQILELKPFERRRAFEEILLQLEAAIVSGQIGAGDKLPSERELAASLGVSRTSVREALRVLEGLGLVRVRPGSEHGAAFLEEPANALPRLFGLQFALRHISLASLIDFRATVETAAAAALTDKGDDVVVEKLARVINQMNDAGVNQVRFHELDANFHLELVRGAGNELASLVLEGIRGAVTKVMLDSIIAAGEWGATRARLVAEHAAILEAIRAGRSEEAAELMERHVRGFYEQHFRPD